MIGTTETSLGFCCGATTLTAVSVEQHNGSIRVCNVDRRRHDAEPKKIFEQILHDSDAHHYSRIAVTGRHFRHSLDLTSISEPQAVETALRYTGLHEKAFDAVVSAGGETFAVYALNGGGKISSVHTGNKCASGTGEFFLQQIRRLDVDLESAMSYALTEAPYQVSGRCSVFCKSDCTHASNKGVPKGQVIAGLCKMMAGKILDLLSVIAGRKILLVGGTAQNSVLAEFLSDELQELVIPDEATYFEALGASCWALEHSTKPLILGKSVFKKTKSKFETLKPLPAYQDQVNFNDWQRGEAQDGDTCILGVDVGSTTTKAVLLRASDLKVVASEYLRTNGDPISAAKSCYRSLSHQIGARKIDISTVGVTGSGRQIVGFHAETDGIINEIIAHATAAVHFDPEVDTLFEIGGQDAKYTYVTAGVASDYAMNEACSAGTGSFLEESAKETMGVEMMDIAAIALCGKTPPNFNDQCAAFISSDIKNALHEGISKEDIAAGLVYSVCMNYVNRVKGERPVGTKVYMQGGVCYNEAVPLAMAALTGKHIVVPPEPGLAGAFGVALEVLSRTKNGLMVEGTFDLSILSDRDVEYGESFTCRGGKEKCDLGCSINRIKMDGRVWPFGGSCNRYYNLRKKIQVDAGAHDFVAVRQQLVYQGDSAPTHHLVSRAPTIGINRSFLTNTYYPFFSTFFTELGYLPVLSDSPHPQGIKRRVAPFCHPCELSYGFFYDLLDKKPDFLFLPHIRGVALDDQKSVSNLCPLVQGEAFFLRGSFEDLIPKDTPILTPLIDFSLGLGYVTEGLMEMRKTLKRSNVEITQAATVAMEAQQKLTEQMRAKGDQILAEIQQNPDQIAVVLFGRPYNAFSKEANKGVPHKFASRGITIIPVDFLNLDDAPPYEHMYWSMGQMILRGAEAVAVNKQLFGVYISSFSCGPDSFLIGYFRDIMGAKPSLTLELDDHIADAGLETRIEAFLDIVARYRTLPQPARVESNLSKITMPVRTDEEGFEGGDLVRTCEGEAISLRDPSVKILLPSMGRYISPAIAAACRRYGARAEALPPMDEEDLMLGKGNTLCKECLPLHLTTGALLKYLDNRRNPGEKTVYFMPTAQGPCRFGQYQVFMKNLILKRRIPNVALVSLSAEDNYGGLGTGFLLLGWYGTVVADCFQDIRHLMIVNALRPVEALQILDSVYKNILAGLEKGKKVFIEELRKAVGILNKIPGKQSLESLPRVLLAGEIFVRQEDIARQWLPEYLAGHGIATHVAPIHEWVYYTNWLRNNAKIKTPPTGRQRITNRVIRGVMDVTSRQVKSILKRSGWYIPVPLKMDKLISLAENLVSKDLYGEAILTIAGPLAGLGTEFCGAIAVGPFGCMPNRLSESLLHGKLDREHLLEIRNDKKLQKLFNEVEELPFLSVEVDGRTFPQMLITRLETFVMQSLRLHTMMR